MPGQHVFPPRRCVTFWKHPRSPQLRQEAQLFWEPRTACFEDVWLCVASRLTVFAWPSVASGVQQYQALIRHWAGLVQKVPAVRQAMFDNEGRFDWPRWWEASHTNRVQVENQVGPQVLQESQVGPQVLQVCFVPAGCEAAFAVFHYTGSWGMSEAHCESIGSILKRYSKQITCKRVVEASILRSAGVRGLGAEDEFLTTCWDKFFKEGHGATFSFSLSQRHRKQRLRRFGLGGGSKTLDRVIRAGSKRIWSRGELRTAWRSATRA